MPIKKRKAPARPKKKAVKKAPKPKAQKPPGAPVLIRPPVSIPPGPQMLQVRPPMRDILDPQFDDLVDVTRDCIVYLQTVSKRINRPANFYSVTDIRQAMIPLPHFYLHELLGSFGLPQSSLIELIGAEGIGKSTFAALLAGCGMVGCGSPVLFVESEDKPLQPDRFMRVLSTDPVKAYRLADRIMHTQAFSLEHMDEVMKDWVNGMRGRKPYKEKMHNFPLTVPLIIVVDVLSKMMTPSEAAGFYSYADNMSEDKRGKFKPTGEGNNMEFAKWMQAWTRRSNDWRNENNVVVIFVSHQNDKVDFNAAGSSMSADVAVRYNKNKRGGRGLNQSAAVQLIGWFAGQAKVGENVVGKKIGWRCDKNSFGADNRQINLILRTRHVRDVSGAYLEPALDLDEGMAAWFVTQHLLGTTVNNKRYTCEDLGLQAVTAEEFSQAFHSKPDVMFKLGARLKYEGYIDIVDDARKAADAPPEEKHAGDKPSQAKEVSTEKETPPDEPEPTGEASEDQPPPADPEYGTDIQDQVPGEGAAAVPGDT